MKIRIVQGDITMLAADAVVHAANQAMLGGDWQGGRKAGGPRSVAAAYEVLLLLGT